MLKHLCSTYITFDLWKQGSIATAAIQLHGSAHTFFDKRKNGGFLEIYRYRGNTVYIKIE